MALHLFISLHKKSTYYIILHLYRKTIYIGCPLKYANPKVSRNGASNRLEIMQDHRISFEWVYPKKQKKHPR